MYNSIREVKSLCRPPEEVISITEIAAVVLLQNLLNHTVKRLCELQMEIFLEYIRRVNKEEIEVLLSCLWGIDGSTGFSVVVT
jgi:hypothetical protein